MNDPFLTDSTFREMRGFTFSVNQCCNADGEPKSELDLICPPVIIASRAVLLVEKAASVRLK